MSTITRTEEVHVTHRADRLGPEHVVLYTDVTDSHRYVARLSTYWSPWKVDFPTLAQAVRETLQEQVPGLLLDDENVEDAAQKLRTAPTHAYQGD